MKRRIISLLLIMTLVLQVTACKTNNSGNKKILSKNVMENIKPVEVNAKDVDDRFLKAYSAFCVNVFKENFKIDQDNNLLSPYSIMSAFALAENGAGGKTLSEMEEVFGIKLDDMNKYINGANKAMQKDKDVLSIANSIWFKSGLVKLNENYLAKNKSYFDSSIYEALFDKSTVDDINNWVDLNSHGMIKKVIDEIDDEARLILVNAMAFEGLWKDPYADYQVTQDVFYNMDGSESKASFMHSMENRYIALDNATGFYKPYEDDKFSFVALLPDEGISIEDFIASMDEETFATLYDHSVSEEVQVALPKFTYDYTMPKPIKVLNTLGINDAFTSNADFSGIGETDQPIYIGDVIHKTFIDVCESGTRAAAVTALELKCGSAIIEKQPKQVTLERPFVYAIINNETGIPVFVGTVTHMK